MLDLESHGTKMPTKMRGGLLKFLAPRQKSSLDLDKEMAGQILMMHQIVISNFIYQPNFHNRCIVFWNVL